MSTNLTTEAELMRKAAQAIPNQQLKQARELRGWSQKYVADQIGADNYYLSRWERGTASPSPYYRNKLCVLFGKNARELGLLQDEPGSTMQRPISKKAFRLSPQHQYTIQLFHRYRLVQ